MVAKNHYDKATENWFKEHIDAETTVMKCDACGLMYKPNLGHKCKKEKTMPKLTCYDCIHCSACSDTGDPGFSYLKEDVSECKHFRNKAEYMIVKNEKPDIAAVKRFINILKSHAYYIEFPKVHRVVDEDDIDATLKDMMEVGKPQTNYDRIKSMSMDELADFFYGSPEEEFGICETCKMFGGYGSDTPCKTENGVCFIPHKNKAFKKWLLQEVEK